MVEVTPFTITELRKIVVQAGFPDVLLIHHELFTIAYGLMRNVPSDSEGEYIMIFRTKVRPYTRSESAESVVVNLGESKTVFGVEYI